MDQGKPQRLIFPRPQTAKTFGILSIVFASSMLVCGIGSGVLAAAAPMLATYMEGQDQRLRNQINDRQAQRIAEFREQLIVAKTEPEKAEIRMKINEAEARPPAKGAMMTLGFDSLKDPRITVYSWSDLITSFIANLVLLIAGINLLRLKEQGRRLSLIAAGLKLALIVFFGIWAVTVVMPVQLSTMNNQLDQVQLGPGARPPFLTKQFMTAMVTGGYAVSFVSAAIYPVLMLIFLTRPGVKAACLPSRSKPDPEPTW